MVETTIVILLKVMPSNCLLNIYVYIHILMLLSVLVTETSFYSGKQSVFSYMLTGDFTRLQWTVLIQRSQG